MIWAEDPYVREVQEKYWNGIDDEVKHQIESAGIVHPTGNSVAQISLMFMRKLIDEVRAQHCLLRQPLEDLARFALEEIERDYANYLTERATVAPLTRADGTRPKASVVYK